MAYATSNPPMLAIPTMGGLGPQIWKYESADAIATVDTTDYITNADDLGMQTGDVIFVLDTTNSLTTIGQITVDADGNGTVTALTAVP